MTPTILALLLLDVLLAAAGQLLLKRGMVVMGDVDIALKNIPTLIIAAIKNWYIWIALVSYGSGFIVWLFILSKAKLSVAYPFATSLIFVLVVTGSWLFLKESISTLQILGAFLILVGIILLVQGTNVVHVS